MVAECVAATGAEVPGSPAKSPAPTSAQNRPRVGPGSTQDRPGIGPKIGPRVDPKVSTPGSTLRTDVSGGAALDRMSRFQTTFGRSRADVWPNPGQLRGQFDGPRANFGRSRPKCIKFGQHRPRIGRFRRKFGRFRAFGRITYNYCEYLYNRSDAEVVLIRLVPIRPGQPNPVLSAGLVLGPLRPTLPRVWPNRGRCRRMMGKSFKFGLVSTGAVRGATDPGGFRPSLRWIRPKLGWLRQNLDKLTQLWAVWDQSLSEFDPWAGLDRLSTNCWQLHSTFVEVRAVPADLDPFRRATQALVIELFGRSEVDLGSIRGPFGVDLETSCGGVEISMFSIGVNLGRARAQLGSGLRRIWGR